MLETLIVVLLILWLVGLGWGRGRRHESGGNRNRFCMPQL